MQNHDLLPQVRALRAGGRSPKEIARILGVTPAVAARLVRAAAATQPPRRARRRLLDQRGVEHRSGGR